MRWPAWRPETSLQQRWLHNCIDSLEKNETSLLKTCLLHCKNRLKQSNRKTSGTRSNRPASTLQCLIGPRSDCLLPRSALLSSSLSIRVFFAFECTFHSVIVSCDANCLCRASRWLRCAPRPPDSLDRPLDTRITRSCADPSRFAMRSE